MAREQALVEGVSAGVEGEKAKGEGPESGASSLAKPRSGFTKRVTFEKWVM